MWRLHAALALCCTTAICGCAAYRFGSASLYPPDIQTVYVPVFESDSFRRNLAEFLTEAIVKEIELKTPYKVVGTPQADSVLSGKITTDTKRVIVEDRYDYPRETQVNLSVEVRWVNRRGDLVNQPYAVPVPQSLVILAGDGTLVPEYGQSLATAQLQAIQSLAQQIVSLMEMPW
jgi:Lipopolysaccharide-assembly